jgi:tRNA pseudouridine13 synthase
MALFRPSPQTFFVEELPAYAPSGLGAHTYLWIEKRGLTTVAAIAEVARRLGVLAREVGYAGMKDRHATTRQWLSAPGVDPVAALASSARDPGVRVLRAERHTNKLRIGHLRGNRFTVRLSEVRDADQGMGILSGLKGLARDGLPNRYGDQRFGVTRSNVAQGLALLRGEGRCRDHRRRKLLLSAVQSAIFNQVLERRQTVAGGLRRVLEGDILQKTDSGGVFFTDDPALDQARVDDGAVVITGPLPGSWARAPAEGSAARAIEDEAMAEVGVTRAELGALGKELPGARRPFWVPVVLEDEALTATAWEEEPTPSAHRDPSGDGDPVGLTLSFRLPAGTYATVLLTSLGVPIEAARDHGPADGTDRPTAPTPEDGG